MERAHSARKSSARNAFGKELSKNRIKCNVELGGGIERGIDANDQVFVVPWKVTGGGALACFKHDQVGKLSEQPSLLQAHKSPLTSFALCDIDSSLLATSARDATVRLWRFTNLFEGLSAPTVELTTKSKRVDTLLFHPTASGILATTGASGDESHISIVDIGAAKVAIDLNGGGERTTAIAWSSEGQQLAAGSRDTHLRLFDVRAKQALTADVAAAHDNVKGFAPIFVPRYGAPVQGGEPLCTIGFSKSSEREIALWDQRKLSGGATARVIVDHQSGNLSPFYDDGTGVLYLGGKGRLLYYYEINGTDATVQLLDKFQSSTPFDEICMLPKRVVDFRNCELARFLRVTSQSVEPFSIYVPRKNKDVFHDDVYNGVRAGEPALKAVAWLNGANVPPVAAMLRPKGMRSVYDLSLEEGGKAPEVQRIAQAYESAATSSSSSSSSSSSAAASTTSDELIISTSKEGAIQLKLVGWFFDSYENRYARLNQNTRALYLSQNEGAATVLDSISLRRAVVGAAPNDPGGLEFSIREATGKERQLILRASSIAARDAWLASIQRAIAAPDDVDAGSSPMSSPRQHFAQPFEESAAEAAAASGEAVPGASPKHFATSKRVEGSLIVLSNGGVVNEHVKHWAVLRFGVLSLYESKQAARSGGLNAQRALVSSSPPLMSFHMDRLCAIRQLPNLDSDPTLLSSPMMADSDTNSDGKGAVEQQMHREATSFRVVLPDRCVDFEAPTPVECAHWMRALNSSLDDDNESVDDADVDWRYTMQSAVSEYEGFLYGWQTAFAAIYDAEMLVMKDRFSTVIKHRMAIANIVSASVSNLARNGTTMMCGLELSLSNGRSLSLRCGSAETASHWVDAIAYLRKRATDVLTQLLPDVDAAQLDSLTVDADADMIAAGQMLDPVLLRKGQQHQFIQLMSDARRLRLFQQATTFRALRSDCVFVLDVGRTLWQWNGKSSTRLLRAKAMDLTNRINKKERGGSAAIYVIDEDKPVDLDVPIKDFWALLGGQPQKDGSDTDPKRHQSTSLLRSASASSATSSWFGVGKATSDGASATTVEYVQPSIYSVANDAQFSTAQALRLIHSGASPSNILLASDGAFIVDCFAEIYAWIGKASSLTQRTRCLKIAKLMRTRRDIDGRERPSHTTVSRVIESAEPMLFKERFVGYPGMLPISMKPLELPSNVAAKKAQAVIDVAALLAHDPSVCDNLVSSSSSSSSLSTMARSASSASLSQSSKTRRGEKLSLAFPVKGDNITMKVWLVASFEKHPVAEENFGIFYSGESYVVLLTSFDGSGAPRQNVIFFFQGRDSTVNEKGTSAYLTKYLQAELTGPSMQIRVEQGKEPLEFLAAFDFAHIVLLGNQSTTTKSSAAVRLLHIQGTSEETTRTQEIVANVSSMTPDGAYLLVDEVARRATTWRAPRARDCELDCATRVASLHFANCTLVNGDDAAFWSALASTSTPPASLCAPTRCERFDTRAFEVSSASGVVTVEPIAWPLRQDDLLARNVYIVDGGDSLWVRFGRSLHAEKHAALDVARRYAEASQRTPIPPVFVTQVEREPASFRALFHAWSPTRRARSTGAATLLPTSSSSSSLAVSSSADLSGAESSAGGDEPWQASFDDVWRDYTRETYTYQELLDGERLPKAVDRTRLEEYLTDDDFQKVFEMTRAQYLAVPAWRRVDLKRRAYLY